MTLGNVKLNKKTSKRALLLLVVELAELVGTIALAATRHRTRPSDMARIAKEAADVVRAAKTLAGV